MAVQIDCRRPDFPRAHKGCCVDGHGSAGERTHSPRPAFIRQAAPFDVEMHFRMSEQVTQSMRGQGRRQRDVLQKKLRLDDGLNVETKPRGRHQPGKPSGLEGHSGHDLTTRLLRDRGRPVEFGVGKSVELSGEIGGSAARPDVRAITSAPAYPDPRRSPVSLLHPLYQRPREAQPLDHRCVGKPEEVELGLGLERPSHPGRRNE